MLGAQIQGGNRFGLYEHGRVISSLSRADHCKDGTAITTAAEGQQFIHWQRCMGQKMSNSQLRRRRATSWATGSGGDGFPARAGSRL
jgi:hypothetical protein